MRIDDRDKVCIVGFCDTSRDLAPYEDESYVLVGLNRGYLFQRRADVWFDMHSPEIRNWERRRPGPHNDWLLSFPGPIYLHEADPRVPNSVTYPLQEVAEDLGQFHWRIAPDGSRSDTLQVPYLTSSIAYEIALAIHTGFKEIMLVGIDLNTGGEYAWQQSGVSHLLGVAMGRGIKIVLPNNCPLLVGELYGRGFKKVEGETLTYAQFETRLSELTQERESVVKEINEMSGAKREFDHWVAQVVPGIDHEAMEQHGAKILQILSQYNARLIQIDGSVKETLYWMHQTPEGQDSAEAIAQLTSTLPKPATPDGGGDMSAFAEITGGEPMLRYETLAVAEPALEFTPASATLVRTG